MPEPQLELIPAFLDQATELFTLLREQVVWDERMKARKTASFGVAYNYSGITYPWTVMLPALEPVCERIAEEIGFLFMNQMFDAGGEGQPILVSQFLLHRFCKLTNAEMLCGI